MKKFLKSAGLLLIGVGVGWWLHGAAFNAPPVRQHAPGTAANAEFAIPVAGPAQGSDATPADTATNDTRDPANAGVFRHLLEQQDFAQALAYYEQALLLEERHRALLKPVLENYLQSCLQQCSDGVFVDLVDLWLDTYYQDIEVLLLLAEHQRLQGLPEVAASTLQMAATYAWQPRQREQVSAAVQGLVQATDDSLSRQQSWIELLGFYEYLQVIDLGQPEFSPRQAALAQRMDAPGKPDRPMHSIPVTRRGDHFLVATSINETDQVILMIDTGASVTTLAGQSFAGLVSTDYEYRGSHVFNTANGLTQGEVYRTASISLGASRIADIDIAVLNYQPAEGVDGVLGMNVLRNYRFEIDQDQELLYLRPRR
jgi:clan AA aspartic protease (TIGR02281 family)